MRVLGDILAGDDATITQARQQARAATVQAALSSLAAAAAQAGAAPTKRVSFDPAFAAARAGGASSESEAPSRAPLFGAEGSRFRGGATSSFPPAGPPKPMPPPGQAGRRPPAGPTGGSAFPPFGPQPADPDLLWGRGGGRGGGGGGRGGGGGDSGGSSSGSEEEEDAGPQRDSLYFLMRSMARQKEGRAATFEE
jgi:hypothetical protein